MKRIVSILAILAVIVVSPFAHAEGEPLSDAQINTILSNCESAQIGMQRLQQAEKPTRINRGYLYESTLKLMVNLNSRAAQQNLDAAELLTVTSEYEKVLKQFSTAYTTYDDSMSALVKMNCREEPTTFYDQLVETRNKRAELHAKIVALDNLLNRYQTGLDSIKKLVAEDR